jgi:Anti-sigma factor NepR
MVRDLAPADLRAVRTAIGAELRRLYSDVLREEIPDRMAELLKRLDQPKEAGPRAQDIDKP